MLVTGYDDRGLPITKNVLAKTKTECVAKLKKLQETCGEKPNEKLQPDMTFGEWMDFWYQNYSRPKLRPTTQMGYENAIYKHIIPALGKIPLSELGANEIQQFYAKLKKEGRLIRTELYGEGVSDRTVWSCHTRIRTALDRAVQDGLIRTNPAADCKLPPQNTKEMKVLSREEMQRFLIQAKEEGYFESFLLELAIAAVCVPLNESLSRYVSCFWTGGDSLFGRACGTSGVSSALSFYTTRPLFSPPSPVPG